jgi:hypothetical protein
MSGSGPLTIENSPFLGNRAMAGTGGAVRNGPAGPGGYAFGGAVDTAGPAPTTITGTLGYTGSASNPTALTVSGLMSGNLALGGSGGQKDYNTSRPWSSTDAAGRGGDAEGGAVAATGGTLHVEQLALASNGAYAGNGGSGDPDPDVPQAIGTPGGDSGTGSGGGLYTLVDTTLQDVTFVGNAAAGGRLDQEANAQPGTLQAASALSGGEGGHDRNGVGLPGGAGGSAYGGAVYGAGSTLSIVRGTFLDNQTTGGVGGSGAAGADVHGAGQGGTSPAINWESHGPQAGGDGGAGGDVSGGAIAVIGAANFSLASAVLAGNTTIAGRGGDGGRSGTFLYPGTSDQGGGAEAGAGGHGGDSSGGAVAVIGQSTTTTVTIADSLAARNVVVAGDGGYSGNGGADVDSSGQGTQGGPGGRIDQGVLLGGGAGGSASGGGVYLDNVAAAITRTTVQENTVSGGWGGTGGYGGPGIGFAGGTGGPGGHGGDAAGGGIALVHGSLILDHSTVFSNHVFAGPGGAGGAGGPGIDTAKTHAEGGSGGPGGHGGSARGGGVYVASNAQANTFAGIADTVTSNTLQAGFGGFGGAPGEGTHTLASPNRYQAAPGQTIAMGALAVLQGSLSPAVQSTGLPGDFGRGNTVVQGLDTANYILGGSFILGELSGALAGIVGIGLATGSAAASSTLAAPILVVVAAEVIGLVAVTTAVFLTAEITAEAIATGDFTGAVRHVFGHNGGSAWFGGVNLGGSTYIDETAEPPPTPTPGLSGADALAGATEGSDLWGAGNLSLSRTIVAQGSATDHQWSRTAVNTATFGDTTDLQVVSWGDGSAVPTTGSLLMVVGTDPQGLLHIRMFNHDGFRILDGDETTYPEIASLKQQVLAYQAGKQFITEVNGNITVNIPVLSKHDLTNMLASSAGAPTPSGGFPSDFFELSETTSPMAVEDIYGSFSSDGTNLIGAVDSGYTSDLHGTTDAPLDPKLASTTANNGGTTPTLALLAGSPAFRAVAINGSDTSQNGFVWTGTADIGAWGGLVVPLLTVSGPGPITYDGNSHGATATVTGLHGATVAGTLTFTYYAGDRASGPALPGAPTQAGDYTVVVDFASTDSTYAGVESSPLSFNIAQAALTITANNLTKTYGQPVTFAGTEFTTSGLVTGDTVALVTLTSPGADALAGVAGSPYSITPGAAQGAGLSNYKIRYNTGTLVVNPVTPVVTWANPADITYGTILTSTQFNPTDSVTVAGIHSAVWGFFTYTPAPGTLLNAGPGQTLSALFTPYDTTDYTSASATVSINVLKAPTQLTLAAAQSPSVPGQYTTFTATATTTAPGAGYPTGTVTVTDTTTGQSLGSATLTNGVATITVPFVTLGTHQVTAAYTPTPNFAATSLAPVNQVVQPVAFEPGPQAGQWTLFVGGTNADDKINIQVQPQPSGSDRASVQIQTNGVPVDFKSGWITPPSGSIVQVVAYGLDGNDTITVQDEKPGVTALLFGGNGNDTLNAGHGPTALVGGAGNDVLNGGDGPSILIGGPGPDTLKAGKGNTLLIGGSTAFDDPTPANLAALDQILNAWSSGGGTAASSFLNRSTIHDDGSADAVTGGDGTDWFLVNLTQDSVKKKKAGDVVTDTTGW